MSRSRTDRLRRLALWSTTHSPCHRVAEAVDPRSDRARRRTPLAHLCERPPRQHPHRLPIAPRAPRWPGIERNCDSFERLQCCLDARCARRASALSAPPSVPSTCDPAEGIVGALHFGGELDGMFSLARAPRPPRGAAGRSSGGRARRLRSSHRRRGGRREGGATAHSARSIRAARGIGGCRQRHLGERRPASRDASRTSDDLPDEAPPLTTAIHRIRTQVISACGSRSCDAGSPGSAPASDESSARTKRGRGRRVVHLGLQRPRYGAACSIISPSPAASSA